MEDITVKRYSAADSDRWNRFVAGSRNGTFLFDRRYMDYHADRFDDFSLMVCGAKDELLAILPASIHDSGRQLRSHGGLTYGGLTVGNGCSAVDVLNYFSLILDYLREQGVESLIYKPVPHIYHSQPSDDDIYALFINNAAVHTVNLATAIDLRNPLPSSRLGKRAAKRMARFGLEVEETSDASLFWQIIVDDRRERHNAVPVHSLAEIQMLHDRLPDNVRFFTCRSEAGIEAGAVVYDDRGVLHLQYAAATARGKETYAVDAIYHELINRIAPGRRYFDFGTSNENSGRYLNAGMVHHKEEFGGRSVAYPTYKVQVTRDNRLVGSC